MIDLDEVPLRIEEQVAFVLVDVGHKVVEQIRPMELVVPLSRIGRVQFLRVDLLQHPGVFDPELHRHRLAVEASSDCRRHHVQFKQPVELVRGDFRLVAFPEAISLAGADVLDGCAVCQPAGREIPVTGGQDADLGCFVALDVRRAEKLLEFRIAADPDSRVNGRGRYRRGGLRQGKQERQREPRNQAHNRLLSSDVSG